MNCFFSSAFLSLSLLPSPSPLSEAQVSIFDCNSSRVCWVCAINRRCSSTKAALRSRTNRPLTDRGMTSYRRMLPNRILLPGLGAHSPSVSERPDFPLTTTGFPFSVSSDETSGIVVVAVVSMSPSPVQSKKSRYLGNPSLVSWSPAAARSHPVSRTAIFTPRPSALGSPCKRSRIFVSCLGIPRLEEKALDVADTEVARTMFLATVADNVDVAVAVAAC
mmetsp:Transcript_5226/g.10761  ORF Transcript_5226/g.10761 Transcript_5226/m.10761 type:complete len:220 (-) Transcript_5226:162-821(-)